MQKENNRFHIEKYLSTPIKIYVILFLITIVFLFCGFQYNCVFAQNVGYSLLASLIAGSLIDLGNTRAYLKAEKKQLDIITAEFHCGVMGLKDAVVRAYTERYCDDHSRHTFDKWLELALDMEFKADKLTDEDMRYVVWEIQYQVSKIQKASAVLQERLMQHVSLSIVTEEDRRNVRRITTISSFIEGQLEKGKYKSAIKNIEQRLIPYYLEINPKATADFREEYQADED